MQVYQRLLGIHILQVLVSTQWPNGLGFAVSPSIVVLYNYVLETVTQILSHTRGSSNFRQLCKKVIPVSWMQME